MLSIDTKAERDETITRKQFHTYTPFTNAYGHGDEIRIAIQSQDLYVLPCESYLMIEVAAARKADAPAEQNGVFIYNFESAFFSDVRYEINGRY